MCGYSTCFRPGEGGARAAGLGRESVGDACCGVREPEWTHSSCLQAWWATDQERPFSFSSPSLHTGVAFVVITEQSKEVKKAGPDHKEFKA